MYLHAPNVSDPSQHRPGLVDMDEDGTKVKVVKFNQEPGIQI